MTQILDHVATDEPGDELPELPEIDASMSREEYHDTLRDLSDASATRYFNAFVDIDWNHPDFEIRADDERWVLPEIDAIGGSDWYKSQPLEKQIAIGQWRQANIMKVGVQFENLLIRGIMVYCFKSPNGNPEFRYLMHEATEECHHNQMFQEGVNRIGYEVPGMPWLLRKAGTAIASTAGWGPMAFFIAVLAGEEPIDHTQKSILRAGDSMHPMIQRIMQIHVAEEARHISFAHAYITRHAQRLSWAERQWISLLYPVIMRIAGDAILVPPKEMREEFDIPKKLMKDLYWKAPASRVRLSEVFADVRRLAEEAGLMTPLSRRVWKWLKIDGRTNRYRSEPATVFSGPKAA